MQILRNHKRIAAAIFKHETSKEGSGGGLNGTVEMNGSTTQANTRGLPSPCLATSPNQVQKIWWKRSLIHPHERHILYLTEVLLYLYSCIQHSKYWIHFVTIVTEDAVIPHSATDMLYQMPMTPTGTVIRSDKRSDQLLLTGASNHFIINHLFQSGVSANLDF